eukprot:9999864-Alexandrium_andersonii.AAC.1
MSPCRSSASFSADRRAGARSPKSRGPCGPVSGAPCASTTIRTSGARSRRTGPTVGRSTCLLYTSPSPRD